MLRITADVNGHVVGRLFIHNTGKQLPDNVWVYDAATWDSSTLDGVFGIEGIRHRRNHSWHRLVNLVAMQGGL